MMGWSKRRWITAIAGLVVGALLVVYYTCAWKLFLPARTRALHALKNRTAIPEPKDYDPAVSLAAVLRDGDDTNRWSQSRAAVVEGFVVDIFDAGVELANCLSSSRRDAHIEVGLRPDAPRRERMTVEVTPLLREWAGRRGMDWSTPALRRTLIGRRARFKGWLLFDSEHADGSENTRPGGTGNFRATAWELHPVTSITVIE